MKHETFHQSKKGDQSDLATPVRQFVCEHRNSLMQAARLLGGYDAAEKVNNLAETLEHAAPISRQTKRVLCALLDLLSLENVGDPERSETGYFASINSTDAVVAEICFLTDGLSQAIDESFVVEQCCPRRLMNRGGDAQ